MRLRSLRIVAGVLAGAAFGWAQNAQFEAASLKATPAPLPGLPCSGGPGTADPGTFSCHSVNLSLLVMMAWDIRPFQLKAPSWMDTATYEVVAKVPPNTNRPAFDQMLRKLLAQRLSLQAHLEQQSMTGYDLIVGKNGSKLTVTKDPAPPSPERAWRPPAAGPSRRTKAAVTRRGDTSADLASLLTDYLGAPVRDMTGLPDRYDYTLIFVMEPGGRAVAMPDESGPEFGNSLPYAVQQIGLQLKATKGVAAILVVDRAEKIPAEN